MTRASTRWLELLDDYAPERVAPTLPASIAAGDVDCAAVLGAAGFVELVSDACSAAAPVTFVVNDSHRFTDTRSFLDAALTLVDEAGPPSGRARLRLLVAQGSHRAAEDERVEHEERMCGGLRSRFTEVEWHDGEAGGALARVGSFEFHRWMAEGGFYVACGSMEPHYFAGVTGAHKTLTVGVMSRADIEANHAAAMQPEAGAMCLAGNPVHEGIVAALQALEASGARLLALNQVIAAGRTIAAFGGGPLDALEAGLSCVLACYAATLERPADLLVATVAAPLDRDLYQADKGIKNCEAAVADGGVLILDADCSRGIGIDHFIDLLGSAPTHAEALAAVAARGYRLGDHKAVRLRALTDLRGVRLAVVSRGLDASLSSVLNFPVFASREEALPWIRERVRAGATRAVVVDDAGNLALALR